MYRTAFTRHVPLRALQTQKRHIPPNEGDAINPISLLLSNEPVLGQPYWPVHLSENLEQAFKRPSVEESIRLMERTGLGKNKLPRATTPTVKVEEPPPIKSEVFQVLSRLYTALNKDDIEATVQVYIELKALNGLHKLVDTDIIRVSKYLIAFLSRAPESSLRTSAEDMAVHFAARGLQEPLNETMDFHLKQENFQRVQELWHELLREKKRYPGKIIMARKGQNQNQTLLLFAAAAAAQNDYRSVVTAVCTSTLSNAAAMNIEEFIAKHISHFYPAERQRLRDFIFDATFSRDIRYTKALVDDVVEFARLSDGKAMRRLLYHIKDGLDRGVFVTSPPPVPEGAELPFAPQVIDLKVWSLLTWGAVECRQVSFVETIIEEMEHRGIVPNIDIWNHLLYGFSKKGRVDRMMEVIEKIRVLDMEPNIRSLIIVMSALFDARRIKQAMDVFESIQAFSLDSSQEASVRAAHNIAINGLLRNRMIDESHELLRRMQSEGPTPDIVTWNTFLNRHTYMKDRQGVAEILRSIADSGLKPDIYTFTILYVGATRSKDSKMQAELLRQMKSLQVKANNAILSIGIQSILTSESSDAIENAKNLLDKMERDPDKSVQPNEVTYSTVMSAIDTLIEKEIILPEDGFKHLIEIYTRLVKRGFRPNRPILNLMLKHYLRRPGPESLKMALKIFDSLIQEEADNQSTWYLFLTGLERRREYALAKERVKLYWRFPFEPRRSLVELMDRIARS